MNGIVRSVMVGTCALAIASGAAVVAQDDDGESGTGIAPAFDQSSVDWEAGMKVTTPSREHEMLEFFAGEWDVETTVFMPGQKDGSPPSKGTSKGEMIMGGRFVEIGGEGEFMGRPAASKMLIGFDRFENRYDMLVINTTSTAMYTAHGLANMEGNAIVFHGNMAEPALGLHDREVRYIVRRQGEDAWVLEVYDLHVSEEGHKVVETRYTRAG